MANKPLLQSVCAPGKICVHCSAEGLGLHSKQKMQSRGIIHSAVRHRTQPILRMQLLKLRRHVCKMHKKHVTEIAQAMAAHTVKYLCQMQLSAFAESAILEFCLAAGL